MRNSEFLQKQGDKEEVCHWHFLNQYLDLSLIWCDCSSDFLPKNSPQKGRNSSARLVSSRFSTGSPKQCGLAFLTSSSLVVNNVQSPAGPFGRDTQLCHLGNNEPARCTSGDGWGGSGKEGGGQMFALLSQQSTTALLWLCSQLLQHNGANSSRGC